MKPIGRHTFIKLTLAALCSPSIATPPAKQPLPPHTPNADLKGAWDTKIDPSLPNVLILGDSISIAYTRPVRDALRGIANVLRPMRLDRRGPDNCGDTTIGLENLDRYLGDIKWDIIHFNWGLWDLCYRHPQSTAQGNRDKEKGTQSVSPKHYEANLEKIIARLQQTGAKLIWASTTLVPEGEVGRFVGDDTKYNTIAARIMNKHSIPINDLHRTSSKFPPNHFVAPGDVHFTPEGSRKLAAEVTKSVSTILLSK